MFLHGRDLRVCCVVNDSESHWANPQYVLKLQDTDDDDDSVCSIIIQLMQKDRRKIKQKGENYQYIGFVIYRVTKLLC